MVKATPSLGRSTPLSTCSPQGWCLVEEGKDCRPPSWAHPARPCEAHNMTAAQRALYAERFKPRAKIGGQLVKGIAMNEA